MIVFVKKYWERIVLLFLVGAFFFFVGGGVYLQRESKLKLDPGARIVPPSVEMQTSQKTDSQPHDIAAPEPASFYLKPLPGELMEQIANLGSLDEKVATGKFSGLPVMWSGYFFSLQKNEDNIITVQLDVSEDGFGVIIICDVDLDEYPDMSEIESGKKIWVAGEILSVDPSGTGTIYLKTDYFSFTEQPKVEPESSAAGQ